MTTQVAADLRAAADVLRRDGWTQETYIDVTTRCRCAVGALIGAVDQRASRLAELSQDGLKRVIAAENALSARIEAPVLDWNDRPERTADEVIAALEAAAQTAEQQA